MKKEFFGTCVENPFEDVDKLSEIIDSGEEISQSTFLSTCSIDEELESEIQKYGAPSFTFWKSGNIYFFVWSAIEHFYS